MTSNQKIGLAALLLFLLWKKPIVETIIDTGSGRINTSNTWLGMGVYQFQTKNGGSAGALLGTKAQFDEWIANGNTVTKYTKTNASGVAI